MGITAHGRRGSEDDRFVFRMRAQANRGTLTAPPFRRTEEAYLGWTKRFILFHRKRHPPTEAIDGCEC
jgi:hypothetical protein